MTPTWMVYKEKTPNQLGCNKRNKKTKPPNQQNTSISYKNNGCKIEEMQLGLIRNFLFDLELVIQVFKTKRFTKKKNKI